MGFHSRRRSRKGPYLGLRGESPDFSRVAAGNLGFLSSYDRVLRDPIVLPQESQVSMWIARDLLRLLSSLYPVLCLQLVLRQEPQASTPVLTWISGFRWSFNRGIRPHLMWSHGSPLSSRAVKIVSGFLSSWHRHLWLSLEVPPGCHSYHRVLSRYLGWQSTQCREIKFIWSGLVHRGILELWHDPWNNSRVSVWDRLILSCDRNSGILFPMKQGNGLLLGSSPHWIQGVWSVDGEVREIYRYRERYGKVLQLRE